MSNYPARKRGETVNLEGHAMTLADRTPWTGGWWAQDETGAMWGLTAHAGRIHIQYRPETVATMTAQVTAWAPENYAATVGRGFFGWDRVVSDAARGMLVRERAA